MKFLGCLLCLCVPGQESPRPGLPEGALIVARARARAAEISKGQPNYTCTQTIERSERPSATKQWSLKDTVRLEVALVDGKEQFAWPGSDRFESDDIRTMVGGTIGNGDFAIFLRAIFLSSANRLIYAGREDFDGRPAHRLNYKVPRAFSGYRLTIGPRDGIVGYEGSTWVDAHTYDPLRIQIVINDIPVDLPIREGADRIDFARTRIGESEYVLPLASEMVMTRFDGSESRNRGSFSRCRQYGTTSTLIFEDPVGIDKLPEAPVTITLPPGLEVDVRLTGRIRSSEAAIGDAIEAIVTRDVKRDKQVLLPKGAKAEGRIVQLGETGPRSGFWIVELRLTRFLWENKTAPVKTELFYPMLIGMPVVPGLTRDSQGNLGVAGRAGRMDSPASGPGTIVIRATLVDIKPGTQLSFRIR